MKPQADFAARSAREQQIAAVILSCRAACGYTADPHTACGLVAAGAARERGAPTVILATASPAKFPDAMQQITGERPQLPPRLSRLMTDPERFDVLPNDLAAVQAYVASRSRSQKEGAA